MDTLNFIFNQNKEEATEILNTAGYKKINIAETEREIIGYCIMKTRKQYFDSTVSSRFITSSDNIADLIFLCNNKNQ